MPNVASLYSNLRGLQTAIKDTGRLRQILGVLAKHGFGALVTRLELTETAGLKNLMEYRDENEVPFSLARRIRMTIEDLGPTFVKLGQILSTRSDLIPPDVIAELQFLQDRVPPLAWSHVEEQVRTELGKPVDELFADFSRQPLASASIAQVHRARLPDGEEVVVKVQRPGIAATIESDLNILYFLARRAEAMIPELALMDPVGMIGEFEKAIRKEIDFSTERSHIQRFQKNLASLERVRVPRVCDGYSTTRVLTMDFIRGVKVTSAPAELGTDPAELAPRLLRLLFKMIFQDGYFHGDLHPGNVLIQEDGTIALIDFGLVGRLTPTQRDQILDTLVGVSRADYELVARVFWELGIKMPGAAYDFGAFEADVSEMIETHVAGKAVSDIDISAFFADLVSGAIRHQIKMPPAFTMVLKALVTAEGVGKALGANVDFVAEAEPFVRDTLLERYGPSRLIKDGLDTLTGLSRFFREVPPLAIALLRDVDRRRLTVKVDVQNLPEVLAEQRRAGQESARAILFGGSAVAGLLALDHPLLVVGGVNVLSATLLGGAALLAVLLVPTVLRRR